MPNHCENDLRISGPKTKLDEFIEAITSEGETISITSALPMPDVLRNTESPTPYSPEPHPNWAEMLAKGEITQEWHDELVTNRRERYEKAIQAKAETGYSDWYDWALDNWGTKWGDYDHYVSERYPGDGDDNEEHHIGYLTAWGPLSDKFWTQVSKQYPELIFSVSYDEPGMDFIGAGKYHNGEVIFDQYIDSVTEILGDLDWDDDEAREKWMDAKSDLLGALFEQSENA